MVDYNVLVQLIFGRSLYALFVRYACFQEDRFMVAPLVGYALEWRVWFLVFLGKTLNTDGQGLTHGRVCRGVTPMEWSFSGGIWLSSSWLRCQGWERWPTFLHGVLSDSLTIGRLACLWLSFMLLLKAWGPPNRGGSYRLTASGTQDTCAGVYPGCGFPEALSSPWRW